MSEFDEIDRAAKQVERFMSGVSKGIAEAAGGKDQITMPTAEVLLLARIRHR